MLFQGKGAVGLVLCYGRIGSLSYFTNPPCLSDIRSKYRLVRWRPGSSPWLAASQAVIRVRDQGQGIPPETLRHVFDRFYRGGDKGRVNGFGLGLPIGKALIEGQGGSIAIESQAGHGSAAIVRLPIS